MDNYNELNDCLCNKDEPIGKRINCAFILRTYNDKNLAIDSISNALQEKNDSSLLRHELCYILGQMQSLYAVPILENILNDTNDDCMVRHEAAEALGALNSIDSLNLLENIKNNENENIDVIETCKLAIDLIHWKQKQQQENNNGDDIEDENLIDQNPYLSVDPAPATRKDISSEKLRDILLDINESLFNRYRAMFSLRNRGGEEEVLYLAEGFNESESALFRHEIAYVLGQMQHPAAINALKIILENTNENRMVRHEAAEALGAIGGNQVENILKSYENDNELVVKESCEVALDTIDYWNQLQNNNSNNNNEEENI